jgi:hypothetical protein
MSTDWSQSPSTAIFDMSVKGQLDPINSWVTVEPDVYYFVSSTYCSIPGEGGTELASSLLSTITHYREEVISMTFYHEKNSCDPNLAEITGILGAIIIPDLNVDATWHQS